MNHARSRPESSPAPLVLLHGLAGAASDFDAARGLLDNVPSHAPTIDYLDTPGLDIEDLAAAVYDNLPPMFCSPEAVVAGNSLGGVLALALGFDFSRVILISSHIEFSSARLARGEAGFRNELERIFHDADRLTPEMVGDYRKKWRQTIRDRAALGRLRELKKQTRAFDYHHRYSRLQDRILLVCGRQDRISPLPAFEKLTQRYPAMRLSVIEDCGHAVPLEKPGELARLLEAETRPGAPAGT